MSTFFHFNAVPHPQSVWFPITETRFEGSDDAVCSSVLSEIRMVDKVVSRDVDRSHAHDFSIENMDFELVYFFSSPTAALPGARPCLAGVRGLPIMCLRNTFSL